MVDIDCSSQEAFNNFFEKVKCFQQPGHELIVINIEEEKRVIQTVTNRNWFSRWIWPNHKELNNDEIGKLFLDTFGNSEGKPNPCALGYSSFLEKIVDLKFKDGKIKKQLHELWQNIFKEQVKIATCSKMQEYRTQQMNKTKDAIKEKKDLILKEEQKAEKYEYETAELEAISIQLVLDEKKSIDSALHNQKKELKVLEKTVREKYLEKVESSIAQLLDNESVKKHYETEILILDKDIKLGEKKLKEAQRAISTIEKHRENTILPTYTLFICKEDEHLILDLNYFNQLPLFKYTPSHFEVLTQDIKDQHKDVQQAFDYFKDFSAASVNCFFSCLSEATELDKLNDPTILEEFESILERAVFIKGDQMASIYFIGFDPLLAGKIISHIPNVKIGPYMEKFLNLIASSIVD